LNRGLLSLCRSSYNRRHHFSGYWRGQRIRGQDSGNWVKRCKAGCCHLPRL